MTTGPLRIDFSGCRVLITGGSRGIAGEIAQKFAANGAAVALNYCASADRHAGFPDAAERLVAAIRSSGGIAHPLEADLAEPGAAGRLASVAMNVLGSIDILVLSASLQIHKNLLEMTEQEIARQLQVNVVANIQLLQMILPAMRRSGWGRIITIGSVQETAPSSEMPVYSMTKAAQANLVRNLAVENAPFGITVNNVAPGLVKTDRNAFRRRDMAAWERFAAEANPLGRAGLPEDVSGAVLFLASDAASFLTGATLHVTGGAHIPGARPRPLSTASVHLPQADAGV